MTKNYKKILLLTLSNIDTNINKTIHAQEYNNLSLICTPILDRLQLKVETQVDAGLFATLAAKNYFAKAAIFIITELCSWHMQSTRYEYE